MIEQDSILKQDFIPNFNYKSTNGEISNLGSQILKYNEYHLISYNKSVNMWNLKTNTLITSFTSNKHLVSSFTIKDDLLYIGFSNGLLGVYSLKDFNKILMHKLHRKRICQIKVDEFIWSGSSDGQVIKYDMIGESYEVCFKGSSVDYYSVKGDMLVIGCSDSTLIICSGINKKDGSSNTNNSTNNINTKNSTRKTVLLQGRIKYLHILDSSKFLICFRNNQIQIYDSFSDDYKNLITFKKLRRIKIIDNKIFLLSSGVLKIYSLNKTKESYHLEKQGEKDVHRNTVDFIENICIRKDNSYSIDSGKNHVVSYHSSDILKVEKDNLRICTFSKDKLIIWNVFDRLIPYNILDIVEGIDFCIYKEWYVVACTNRIIFYRKDSLKEEKIVKGGSKIYLSKVKYKDGNNKDRERNRKDINMNGNINSNNTKKVYSIKHTINNNISTTFLFNDVLVVGTDKTITFYNGLDIYDTLSIPDYISSLYVNNDRVVTGCINSKVYIYDNSKDLIKTLYGHSLPVIYINIYKEYIYTIGLDKMMKVWGLLYGDCRKSVISTSRNIEVVHENLFLMGNPLKWYIKNKIYHENKYIESDLIYLMGNMLITTYGCSINIYDIHKYGLEKIDEEDSEILDNYIENIVRVDTYEDFLSILEDIDFNYSKFDRIISQINMIEVDTYISILNIDQIDRLIEYIRNYNNKIVGGRIICALGRLYPDVVCGHRGYIEVWSKYMEDIRNIRDRLGRDMYKIIIK